MKTENSKRGQLTPANHRGLATFLNGNEQVSQTRDQPIADFFPNCTVFFGDIAGFTAWSSTREPAQVFILLQTVYQNFDSIAKRRHVFKVETIGTLSWYVSPFQRWLVGLITFSSFVVRHFSVCICFRRFICCRYRLTRAAAPPRH